MLPIFVCAIYWTKAHRQVVAVEVAAAAAAMQVAQLVEIFHGNQSKSHPHLVSFPVNIIIKYKWLNCTYTQKYRIVRAERGMQFTQTDDALHFAHILDTETAADKSPSSPTRRKLPKTPV